MSISKTMHANFLTAVAALGFKFPVAQISKDLNYSDGVVSEYLNSKKMVSERFLRNFCERYRLSFEDMRKEPSDATVQEDPGGYQPILVGNFGTGKPVDLNKYIQLLEESRGDRVIILKTATAAIEAAEAVKNELSRLSSSVRTLEKNSEADQTMLSGLTEFVVKHVVKTEKLSERAVRADLDNTVRETLNKRKTGKSSAVGS